MKTLAKEVDVVLVIGSTTSSNSNRLKEVAERSGTAAYLIENAEALNTDWIKNATRIGITAGASAPEFLVKELVDYLQSLYPESTVTELAGVDEQFAFPMPKGLWKEDLPK